MLLLYINRQKKSQDGAKLKKVRLMEKSFLVFHIRKEVVDQV